MNPMTLIDAYKIDHRRQQPPKTTRIAAYITPRASRVAGQNHVVCFAFQYAVRRYLTEVMNEGFFEQPRDYSVKRYKRRIDGFMPGNNIDVKHIGELHELGFVPLEIRALPEGTLCPLRVPMCSVENTHDDFAWATNYFETLLSSVVWHPMTSATSAYRLRKLLNTQCSATGGDRDLVPWQAHDFSFRGLPGPEAAALSGMGHLLSFYGTDTMPALDLIDDYYEGSDPDEIIGGSVPATEHSVMCAGGQEDEEATFRRLLALYPTGIVSVVSDTWDLWNVVGPHGILNKLAHQINERDGKLVIRPDSGDPVLIICGDPSADSGSPQFKGTVECLWDLFGGTVALETGCRILSPKIGVIYGDSITYERAEEISKRLAAKRFVSTSCVFGVGSFTYQYVTRDTYGFAMKTTWAKIGRVGHDLFKKPVTDDGTKFSAVGRQAVIADIESGELKLVERADKVLESVSLLEPIWRDGKVLRHQSFQDVRRTLWRKKS